MMWETSLVRAINPNWTDLSRVDAIRSSPISHQLKDQPVENLNAIKLANPEHGDYFLNAAADRLAKMAREALNGA
jgi:hypothetical protein